MQNICKSPNNLDNSNCLFERRSLNSHLSLFCYRREFSLYYLSIVSNFSSYNDKEQINYNKVFPFKITFPYKILSEMCFFLFVQFSEIVMKIHNKLCVINLLHKYTWRPNTKDYYLKSFPLILYHPRCCKEKNKKLPPRKNITTEDLFLK